MTQNYERHLKNKHTKVNSKDLRVFGQPKLNDLFCSPRPQECDSNNLGKVVIDQEREEHIGMNVMGEEFNMLMDASKLRTLSTKTN